MEVTNLLRGTEGCSKDGCRTVSLGAAKKEELGSMAPGAEQDPAFIIRATRVTVEELQGRLVLRLLFALLWRTALAPRGTCWGWLERCSTEFTSTAS